MRFKLRGTLLVIGLAILWPTGSAHAYLTRAKFEAELEAGGGAGRYFSGSPLDEQSCDVCHTGGSDSPDLALALPLPDSYALGVPVDLAIQWAAEPGLAGGSIEIVNELGRGMGTIELVEEQASQCSDGRDSTVLQTDEETGRQIAGTDVCGATLLHIVWTPPEDPVGPAFVYATAVMAGTEEGQGQPIGDVSEAFRAVIPPLGENANLSTVKGCSAGGGVNLGATLPLVFGVLAVARRRRRSAVLG